MKPRRLKCGICGDRFWATHSQTKFCSPLCRRQSDRGSWNSYSAKNRRARRRYHRAHYQKNRKAIIARTRAYQKTYAGKESQRKSRDRQLRINPHKIAARQAVAVALAGRRLRRMACAKCGARKVEAHHRNYSRPLDVTWLCPKHHRALHKR